MPLTLTDVWTWKQLVDISHTMRNQKTMLPKADNETLDLLDRAIESIWLMLLDEFERREGRDIAPPY